jgi:hypothetical protein
MRQKRLERLLRDTSKELCAGEQLLKEDQRRAKHGNSKLARRNAKRSAKLIKKALKSIEDYRNILVTEEGHQR